MKMIQKDIILYICLMILGLGGFISALLWPTTAGFYSAMIISALGGLGVTIYIYYAKHYKKNLACPTGSDCNAVVNSKYGKFLGIPLEFLGMTYYFLVVISYLLLLIWPNLTDTLLLSFILILTASAFLFSLYLLFIQGFVLKKWCIWCLLSATLSILIFIASLSSIEMAFQYISALGPLLSLSISLGFIFGLGGATASAVVFFRFLDDFQINDNEVNALKGLAELVWLGLGLVIIPKLIYFVAAPQILSQSPLFIFQIISLLIVFITGAILSVIFSPFICVLPFHSEKKMPSLDRLRMGTMVTASVSIFSWYFVFFSNYLPFSEYIPLTLIYLAVLALAFASASWMNAKLG